MRHLQMSESEIVSSYRTARDPKRQIGILAELNAVTPREIRQVLEEAGALVLKPRSHGGGRPLSFDAAAARQMFEAGLTDEEMARKLGVPEKRLAEWRRRQGLMRPKYSRPPGGGDRKTTAPAAVPEQKEETMAVMTKSASAPAEKDDKVVTVETLFDLLRGRGGRRVRRGSCDGGALPLHGNAAACGAADDRRAARRRRAGGGGAGRRAGGSGGEGGLNHGGCERGAAGQPDGDRGPEPEPDQDGAGLRQLFMRPGRSCASGSRRPSGTPRRWRSCTASCGTPSRTATRTRPSLSWAPSTPTRRRSVRPSRAWRRRPASRGGTDVNRKSPAPEGAGRWHRWTLI